MDRDSINAEDSDSGEVLALRSWVGESVSTSNPSHKTQTRTPQSKTPEGRIFASDLMARKRLSSEDYRVIAKRIDAVREYLIFDYS